MSDSKNRPRERIVAADDDNVPHLENMANVQGSNKHPAKDERKTPSSDSL